MRDVVCPCMGEDDIEEKLPCKPAGHGEIATGSVSRCSPPWRTFVQNFVVIQWIEDDYRL